MKKIFIVSEIFYPEMTSTGFYLTAIAAHLARNFQVEVICARPARDIAGSEREDLRIVRIERIGRMNDSAASLLRRMLGAAAWGTRVELLLVRRLRRGDIVLALTNPPFLPPLAAFACAVKGARLVVLTHDVYPQAAIVAGVLKGNSLTGRVWEAVQRWVYRRASRIICLGRDMRDAILRMEPSSLGKIVVISNWSETVSIIVGTKEDSSFARQNATWRKFVVLYAGNLGRTHDPDLIIRAAGLVPAGHAALFLIAGSGSQFKRLAASVRERPIPNLSMVPLPEERNRQSDTLAAADVVLITFKEGMAGVSVPSRMYNAMAAGRPLIAVAGKDSELARVIREEGIGWITPPGDEHALWQAVQEAWQQPARLREMGRKARAVAETTYSEERILRQYGNLFLELAAKSGAA